MRYGVIPREQNVDSGQVPDVEACLAQAESLGGKRLMGPDEVPGMGITLGHIEDPEGHLIGVIQAPS